MEYLKKKVGLLQIAIQSDTCIALLSVLASHLLSIDNKKQVVGKLIEKISLLSAQLRQNKKNIETTIGQANVIRGKSPRGKNLFPQTGQIWWPGPEADYYYAVLDEIVSDFLVIDPTYSVETAKEQVKAVKDVLSNN